MDPKAQWPRATLLLHPLLLLPHSNATMIRCASRASILYHTRNLGARWAPISSWWPSATLLALRACFVAQLQGGG